MNKFFTIVVCTFNGEKFLDKCLNAILNLSCLEELVEEVLVVDNNSTDNTKEIIKSYESISNLIKYEFEKEQGLSHARRHAVNAKTDWIIYVDDDNILDEKWLVELYDAINKNPNVGIVNGAVIANPIQVLTESEKNCLKVMYRNLACTHISEDSSEEPKNKEPMGAGLCVITEALKKIDKEGWLTLTGRKGEDLSSGEDTELCNRVLIKGYKYILNYRMKLYHCIPKSRLTESYTIKLVNGLIKGRYKYIRNQRFGYIKCLIRVFKYFIIYLSSKLKLKYSESGTYLYYLNLVNYECAKGFILSVIHN